MMTKYQLVFVKMENAFSRVFNSNKLRWLHLKQDAFLRVKSRADEQNLALSLKTHTLYLKLSQKVLIPVVKIYERNRIDDAQQKAFQQWRLHCSFAPALKK